MEPTRGPSGGRHHPGGPHAGAINFAIWVFIVACISDIWLVYVHVIIQIKIESVKTSMWNESNEVLYGNQSIIRDMKIR